MAVTVWAICYTFIFELSFTRYANITPASTCRNDYALTFQNSAVFKFHFNKFFFSKRFARCRFITSMSYSFTCSSRLATSLGPSVFYADEVLNAHSIHYLTTEALSNDTSADAFTSLRKLRTCTSRAATNNKNIVWIFIRKL